MDMKLELVPIPVSDLDRAKAFYVDKVGFKLDFDVQPGNGMHLIQLTPPGSACSILLSAGIPEIDKMLPGSVKAVHLVVGNVDKARAALVERGVEMGQIEDHGGGVKSVAFSDPDGNLWEFQEMSWRSSEFIK